MDAKTKELAIKAGIVVGAFYLVGKPLLKGLGLWPTEPLKTITDEDRNVLNQAGGTPRITRSEAKAIADQQLAAMQPAALWGTDEKALFAALQGLSGPDLAQVFVEFGSKWYDPIFGVESYSWTPKSKLLNLFGWYANELNSKELAQMAAIWKKSGLKFPAA